MDSFSSSESSLSLSEDEEPEEEVGSESSLSGTGAEGRIGRVVLRFVEPILRCGYRGCAWSCVR